MAKAVVLKNPNNEDIFPVTDASLIGGTLNSTTIADSSIEAGKLDWSSMPVPITVAMPSNVTKSISSWTTVEFYSTNVNFPAGKYIVLLQAAVGGTATNGEHWVRCALDDITDVNKSAGGEWQFGQGIMQNVFGFAVWDITAGTHAVKFGAGVEAAGNITLYGNVGTRALFFRVG